MLVSADGITIESISSIPESIQPYGVDFAGGQFFARGSEGIAISSGGVAWEVSMDSDARNLGDIEFGDGIFVSGPGRAYTSTDGLQWTRRSNIGFVAAFAFGNGRYVAVGSGDASVPRITASSSNGISWAVRSSNSSLGFSSVAFGAGRFIAAGSGMLESSLDGGTWTPIDVPTAKDLAKWITFANGQFVATGNQGMILISDDGVQWEDVSTRTGADLEKAVFANGTWLIPGAFPVRSSDGRSWTAMHDPLAKQFQGVFVYNGGFAAFGKLDRVEGTVSRPTVALVSADGEDWSPSLAVDGGFYPDEEGIFSLAFRNSMATSWKLRGDEWQAHPATFPGVSEIFDLLFANGIYLAAIRELNGITSVLTSNDGVAWEKVTGLGAADIRHLAYGDGKFVGIGDTPSNRTKVVISSDGQEWTTATSELDITFPHSLAFGNGIWMIGGSRSFGRSSDATQWTVNRLDISEERLDFPENVQDLTFASGHFIGTHFSSQLSVSADGLAWRTLNVAPGANLVDFAAANGEVQTSQDTQRWDTLAIISPGEQIPPIDPIFQLEVIMKDENPEDHRLTLTIPEFELFGEFYFRIKVNIP